MNLKPKYLPTSQQRAACGRTGLLTISPLAKPTPIIVLSGLLQSAYPCGLIIAAPSLPLTSCKVSNCWQIIKHEYIDIASPQW